MESLDTRLVAVGTLAQPLAEGRTVAQAPWELSLRPVQPEDREFLLDAYASHRKEELEPLGWSDAQRRAFLTMQFDAQQQHYRSHYPDAQHHIVVCDGRPVGRIYVARQDEEIRLLDVTVLHESRGRGLGSALLGALIEESEHTAKPIRLYVLKSNRAVRLYARLGFSVVDDAGLHFFMERTPSSCGVANEGADSGSVGADTPAKGNQHP